MWAGIDEEVVRAASAAALGWLARTGCTTSTDHHYVFPRGAGDLLAAEVDAAAAVGLRFHPTRGSMDLGRSQGGLPPDSVVEDLDAVLAATEAAITASTTRRRMPWCASRSPRARRSPSPAS